MKEFEPPTYEEYKKANAFAKFKYKYGIIIVILAYLTLVALFIYVFYYVQELSTHPFLYAVKKFNIDYCNCNAGDLTYFINSTTIEWRQNPINFLNIK